MSSNEQHHQTAAPGYNSEASRRSSSSHPEQSQHRNQVNTNTNHNSNTHSSGELPSPHVQPTKRVTNSPLEKPHRHTPDDVDTLIERVSSLGTFAAAMKKNFLQKTQDKVTFCLELCLPILFVCGMVGIWAAIGSEKYPETRFLEVNPAFATEYRDIIRETVCIDRASPLGQSMIAAGLNSSSMTPSPIAELCPGSVADMNAMAREKDPESRGVMCSNNTVDVPLLGFCVIGNPFAIMDAMSNFSHQRVPITLDEFFVMRSVWMTAKLGNLDRSEFFTAERALSQPGRIRFAPKRPALRPVVEQLVEYMNQTNFYFKYVAAEIHSTPDELDAYSKSVKAEEEGSTWAGIVVNEMSKEMGFDVTMRSNATNVVYTTLIVAQFYSGGLTTDQEDVQSYDNAGALGIHKTVYDFYVTKILAGTGAKLPPRLSIAPMPFVGYTEWIFLQVGADQGFFALYLVLAYLYPVSQLVKNIVKEKETRIREAMMIMGLGTGAFYVSWFCTYCIMYFIPSIINTIIMKTTFFPKNDFFVIFFVLYLFAISTVSLAGLISTFFSKARISALVSPIVFFILAIPLFLIGNATVGIRGFVLILSPTAVSQAFTLLAKYEQAGGMGSSDVFTARDDINMILILVMLIVDIIVYGLIALYLDTVLPSDWGTRKHPLFCILEPIRWWSRRGTPAAAADDITAARALPNGRDEHGFYQQEDVNNRNPVNVELRGLVKRFERGDEVFTAVNQLHLTLRENEVSVLLGHNGAGKTTAMNLLTGMLEIDEGDAFVLGKSVKHDIKSTRKMIGFCPQHNILWPELTCAQHLRFYAALKGVAGDDREAAVDDMLHAVDLFDKKDYLTPKLSGGQKRKLSVAIAFIGGSPLVILDEPTAGMDVAARRFTWELIKRMSPGRCVLLTTHYMDEADLLGDKISIMDKGRLVCEGSSMFLKSSYSVGYTVTMSVDQHDSGNVKRIRDTFKAIVPSAEQQPSGGEEVAFRVPMKATASFPTLLRTIEDQGASMGVRGYGVTVTTLEDVFMKIVHECDERRIEEHAAKTPKTPSAAKRGHSFSARPSNTGSDGGAVPVQEGSVAIEMAAREREPDADDRPHSRAEASAINSPPPERHWTTPATEEERTLGRQFRALCWKRFHNIRRDRRTQCLQVFLPVGCILMSMLLLLIEIFPAQPELSLDQGMYRKDKVGSAEIGFAHCPAGFTSGRAAQSLDEFYHPMDYSLSTSDSSAFATENYLLQTAKKLPRERFVAMHCDDAAFGGDIMFVNYSSYHVYGEALNRQYKMRIADSTGSDVNPTFITRVDPLPWTDRQDASFGAIRTFMVAIVILIPFTFIPSTFVAWVVKEKECKAKHLQFASGTNFFVYWLSNLVFDMISITITAILVIIIFLIFNRTEYIGSGEAFINVLLLILLYGASGAAMSYVIGFFFEEHSSAQNVVMMGNFIFGFLLVFMIFMFSMFPSTESAAKILRFIFRLVPSYCLGEGIMNLASLEMIKSFDPSQSAFDLDMNGWALIYMSIEFPVFFGIAILLDHPARQRRAQQLLHKPDVLPEPIMDEDPDVARERARIENVDNSKLDDVVIVRHLNKKYSTGKVAVKDLSFGVKKREVFGFLGTNGAGKTTSISILCGEQLPTHGRGYIKGFDVVDDAQAAQQQIGYCPQFDALLELLTAKEHLELYAGLRGVPANLTDSIAEELIEVCGLAEHRHTLAGAMSGGNKRKLSVAIALIGGPTVVFLDEPSAGMDPVARRGLWQVIEDICEHASVVLTTHHLEEVEALAHRVAIMVDGQLMCVGDKTHLKNKYGSGFEMQVQLLNSDSADDFEAFIAERLGYAASLNEKRGLRYTYSLLTVDDQQERFEQQVTAVRRFASGGSTGSNGSGDGRGSRMAYQPIKLSDAFALLEENKTRLGIADYSVSATSIESVFLRISEAADADEGAGSKENVAAKLEVPVLVSTA